MTPLEVLARRRELVLMSCDMQRMTMAVRLARIEHHRGPRWFGAFFAAARLLRSVL